MWQTCLFASSMANSSYMLPVWTLYSCTSAASQYLTQLSSKQMCIYIYIYILWILIILNKRDSSLTAGKSNKGTYFWNYMLCLFTVVLVVPEVLRQHSEIGYSHFLLHSAKMSWPVHLLQTFSLHALQWLRTTKTVGRQRETEPIQHMKNEWSRLAHEETWL